MLCKRIIPCLDVRAIDGSVDRRIRAQRVDGGANEERHERELGADFLLEFGFRFRAQVGDGGDVNLFD